MVTKHVNIDDKRVSRERVTKQKKIIVFNWWFINFIFNVLINILEIFNCWLPKNNGQPVDSDTHGGPNCDVGWNGGNR